MKDCLSGALPKLNTKNDLDFPSFTPLFLCSSDELGFGSVHQWESAGCLAWKINVFLCLGEQQESY